MIPPLGEAESKVLELRTLLVNLHELVDAGTVIKTYGGITLEEMELLAAAEGEIRRMNEEKEKKP